MCVISFQFYFNSTKWKNHLRETILDEKLKVWLHTEADTDNSPVSVSAHILRFSIVKVLTLFVDREGCCLLSKLCVKVSSFKACVIASEGLRDSEKK